MPRPLARGAGPAVRSVTGARRQVRAFPSSATPVWDSVLPPLRATCRITPCELGVTPRRVTRVAAGAAPRVAPSPLAAVLNWANAPSALPYSAAEAVRGLPKVEVGQDYCVRGLAWATGALLPCLACLHSRAGEADALFSALQTRPACVPISAATAPSALRT